jgi:2-polyprenyl-3-methyl-5-hydroxy-6-metoxy-1,4-benzoquinol methylase
MPASILVGLRTRILRHPWWRARAGLLLKLLAAHGVAPPASVLEAGCGWGVNVEALEHAGYRVTGMDAAREALAALDAPQRQLIEADLRQPFPAHAPLFDAVLALDVLEHLDDDTGALRRLAGLLRPGAPLIVSVPALPELFTPFDEVQGHRRRYTMESLRAAIAGAGLEAERVFWWGEWLVPMLRRSRRRAPDARLSPAESYAWYLRLPPWPAPWLLRLLLAWETRRSLAGRSRVGTSLFAVIRRREDEARQTAKHNEPEA